VKYDVMCDASPESPVLKSTRFSELSAFHTALKKEMPNFPSELPRKTLRKYSDAAFIESRRVEIEAYLREVVAHASHTKAFCSFFKDSVRELRLLEAAVGFAEEAHANACEIHSAAVSAAREANEQTIRLTHEAAIAKKELTDLENAAEQLTDELNMVTHAAAASAAHVHKVRARLADSFAAVEKAYAVHAQAAWDSQLALHRAEELEARRQECVATVENQFVELTLAKNAVATALTYLVGDQAMGKARSPTAESTDVAEGSSDSDWSTSSETRNVRRESDWLDVAAFALM
jgi:chromosome segregation ATPase